MIDAITPEPEVPTQALRSLMKPILVFSGRTSIKLIFKIFGCFQRTQRPIISRTTMIAVKTEVTIPKPSVTAKPLTGPEPMPNRITAAISVVILASKIAL